MVPDVATTEMVEVVGFGVLWPPQPESVAPRAIVAKATSIHVARRRLRQPK
jgi:hypothetical protein